MRVTPVVPAFGRNFQPNKSVSFGRFADNNARNVVKETLESIAQPCDNYYYGLIDEADYFTAYTDKDGIVKGEFDDEFLKSDNGKMAAPRIEVLRDTKTLDNLSISGNIRGLGIYLRSIKKIIDGTAPTLEQLRSKDNGPSEQEVYEAERQARLDNLAK